MKQTFPVIRQYARLPIAEILAADGRRRYRVISPWQSLLPNNSNIRQMSPPNAAMVKATIASFERTGRTDHSPMGLFVPYVVAYCHLKGINYRVRVAFRSGIKDENVHNIVAGYAVEKEDVVRTTLPELAEELKYPEYSKDLIGYLKSGTCSSEI
jgi:hypothetical protein